MRRRLSLRPAGARRERVTDRRLGYSECNQLTSYNTTHTAMRAAVFPVLCFTHPQTTGL